MTEWSRRDRVLLIAVIILSFGLRLLFISDMEWNYDEKKAYDLAGEFLRLERLPLVGMDSSVGIPNPPGFIAAVAVFRALATGPLGVAIWIACLNAAAIVWMATHLRPRVGRFVCWTTCLLMATAPWAVIFSRKVWAQDMLAPFGIALMLGMVKAVDDRSPRHWLLVVGAGFCLVQLHLSAVSLVVAVPLVILLSWAPRWSPGGLRDGLVSRLTAMDRRFLIIGIAVAVLLFAPYALLLLKNLSHALQSLRASQPTDVSFSEHAGQSFSGLMQVCGGMFFETTLNDDIGAFRDFCGSPAWLTATFTYALVWILFVAGLALAAARARRSMLPLYVFALVVLHLAYVLFGSTRTGAPYFLLLYPLPFLLIAWGLRAIPWPRVRFAVTVWIVTINILTTVSFLGFVRAFEGPLGGYGVPYRLQNTAP